VAVVAAFFSLALRTPWAAQFFAAAAEARPVPWDRSFVTSVLYLATIGTVGTFFGQTWAQRQMSATHAAILFALEPVFAALLAAPLLGERLGPRGFAGGALVLAGIVASEVRLRRRLLSSTGR
jgi:drug/metabolite transporter (DMT)-like permease